MGYLPKINRSTLLAAFDNVVELFQGGNKTLLIQSAQTASVHTDRPITYSAAASIDNQIRALRHRIGNIGEDEGQNLYVLWVESLCTDLTNNPIPGVDSETVRSNSIIRMDLTSFFEFESDNTWKAKWTVTSGNNSVEASICLRDTVSPTKVVPFYVYEYIDQSLSAFNKNRNGVSMALISVALEASVRDALVPHGYTHNSQGPSSNIYEKIDVAIEADGADYKLSFPVQPQSPINQFSIILPPGRNAVTARIKRFEYNGVFKLQIDSNPDLVEFLSSDTITQNAVDKITGLGKALNVARSINVIDPFMFPEDLDRPIQAVRNNLIHLSGAAMNEVVLSRPSGDITLQEFINSDGKVFDALNSIILLIDELYR